MNKKKWIGMLGGMAILSLMFAVALSSTKVNAAEQIERGMSVETPEDWSELSTNGSFTVLLEDAVFSEGEYLAIDLRVNESYLDGVPNMYTPKLKINGEDILDDGGKSFRFYNRNGNPYDVEYKFGGYFFLPTDANGIIYIPAEDLITENGTLSELFSICFEFSNHARTGEATFYSIFKAKEFAEQADEENIVFNFSAVGTDENGAVTDSWVSTNQLVLTAAPSSNPGYASYEESIFTVTTPTDSLAETYFTVTFPETEFVAGDYLAIDLKVKSATFTGGASTNYAFQIKLNGAAMQHPSGVYKQTFGSEFGAYQRGGTGVGYFGNGIWFFMNADLDAILYIPAEKMLAGTASSNATLQTSLSSFTIDYAGGNVGRHTTVAYYGIFKATAIGETMNESNCIYDFSKVETDANGAIDDESLTVSKLTATVSEVSEKRFVADMVHAFDGEMVYATTENSEEYALRITPENTALKGMDAWSVRLFASRAFITDPKLEMRVKLEGAEEIYTFLNGATLPFMTSEGATGLSVKDKRISLSEGVEGTLYVPFRFLSKNSSLYSVDSLAALITAETKLEYIEIAYTGGELTLGEVVVLRESGGKNGCKSLGNRYSLSSGNATLISECYDNVELYVNGEKAPQNGSANEIVVYGSTFSVPSRVGFFRTANLATELREGVHITSVQTDISGTDSAYLTEWTEDGSLKASALRGRPLDATLALTAHTVVISVIVEGNRSFLLAPEKTVKNVEDETPFSFSVDTEYGAETPVSFEWKVNGKKEGEGKSFLFSPTEIGVYVVELYVNGAFIDARSVTLTDEEIKEFAEGQILGGEYATETSGGFYVSTPEGWVSRDAYFKVDFPETEIAGKYLAVDLKVDGIVYGESILSSQHQYTVKMGINGSTLSQHNASVLQEFSAINRAGTNVGADFKFGNWLFIPENFNGVLYVAAEDLLNASGLQTSLSSFTIDYSGGNVGKLSTVSYNYVYLADEIGDPVSEGTLLIDYRTLEASADGTITDERFVSSGDLIVKNTTKTQAHWKANVIELDDSYEGALKMGVKSEVEGGTAVSGTYHFGWAEARVDPFTPNDGFAVQVYAPSGLCYFKIVLEDENGCYWKVDISSLPNAINPDSFALTYKEEVGMVKGGYGCFYLPTKKIGTLYIPYSRLVPLTDGAEFKGDNLIAGERMGRIVAVHFGLDMVYGLGQVLAVGTFADVNIEENKLCYVFGTSYMSEVELNLENPSRGATFKSNDTAAHEKNWTWSFLTDRELPGYVNKDALIALVAFCGGLDKADYTEESWSKFYGKLAVAKTTSDNPFATQDDVNEATSALSLAKFNLVRLSDLKKQKSEGGCGGSFALGGAICVLALSTALAFKKRRNER